MDLAGGNQQLAVMVVEKFVTHSLESQERMEAALAVRDLPLLRREAHSLKGAAAYVFAEELSLAAKALQESIDYSMGDDVVCERLADVKIKLAATVVDIESSVKQITSLETD